MPSACRLAGRLTQAPRQHQARTHPIDGRILAPVMSRAPKAPAAAVIRQVVQTGSVNFINYAQLPLAQTLSELTSATR